MRKYTCTIAFALSCTFSTFAQTPCLTQNKLIDAQKLKSQKEIQKYEILDNNGSFKYSDLFYFNTEGNAATDDDLYQGAISETRYDDHNNIVLYENRNITSAGIDNATIADGIKNEYACR